MEITGQIEALLFVAGDDGISLDELAFLVEAPTSAIFDGIEELKTRYIEDNQRAIHVLEVGNQFMLTTKREYAELIKNYAQSPIANSLSQAALETLSIIAYKQPITRMEVDDIRGVQSSGSIQKLTARQLIVEIGRVEGPGRAILYGTTAYFMNYFGLESIQDLPSIADMEAEIEQEIPSDLFFANFKEELEGLEQPKPKKSEETD